MLHELKMSMTILLKLTETLGSLGRVAVDHDPCPRTSQLVSCLVIRGVSPNATLIPRRKRFFSLFRSGAREGSRDGLPRECIGRRVRVSMP